MARSIASLSKLMELKEKEKVDQRVPECPSFDVQNRAAEAERIKAAEAEMIKAAEAKIKAAEAEMNKAAEAEMIKAADAKIKAAEAEIKAAESEIGAAEAEIGAAESEIGAAEVEIGAVEVEIGTVEVEVKSEEPEVKQLPNIFSGYKTRSSSKPSKYCKKQPLTNYEKEKKRLKGLHSKKKLVSKKKTISKFRKEKIYSSSYEDEKSSDISSSSAGSEGWEGLKNTLKENEEKSSENEETSSGNVSKRKFSRGEKENPSSKVNLISLIRPIITETNNRVLITMKAVSKKTVIRIFDNEAEISCEEKFRRKSKCDLSGNRKWAPKKTFIKNYKDIIITPKVPKTKASKKRSEDDEFNTNDSDDSDSDKENSFAGSSAENVSEKNEDAKSKNKRIPLKEEVSMSTAGPSTSQSTKRATRSTTLGRRKKIRLSKGSVDKEMKISSEEKDC